MRDAFSDCHPAVNFTFYIGALILGMCLMHPLFLVCSLCLSLAYYKVLKRKLVSYMAGMGVVFVLLTVLNPLFNTYGETILFTYWKGRVYTFEALCYGAAAAAMFVSVLTWFATYNEVMTSDKFLYCFGKAAPSISLIFTMVLRLVPGFQRKTEQIAGARRCIGMSVENGTVFEKAEHGLTLVSALTSWALEGGVVMADSMKSRGFGAGKRTSFSIYKMKRSDKGLLLLMLCLFFMIVFCASKGGMEVTYTPQMKMSGWKSPWTIIGSFSYFFYLLIPTGLQLREDVLWRILKLKI